MPLNRKRLLELAAERLEVERQRIGEELAEIKAELGLEPSTPKTRTRTRKRRSLKLSAKEHKARSDRMKKYWAARKKKEKQQAKGK